MRSRSKFQLSDTAHEELRWLHEQPHAHPIGWGGKTGPSVTLQTFDLECRLQIVDKSDAAGMI